jgi:hypothetical protein
MARVKYIKKVFRDEKDALVEPIQRVFAEYAAQGYLLNARGIAYRLEGQGIIRKTEESFQQVETVVKEGRDMGLFDWDGLPVDSARALRDYAMWLDPAHRLRSAAANHTIDKWARQENRVEVWTEKEGLLGVIRGACENEDVPFRALTGYDAVGAAREGARRILTRNWIGRMLVEYQDAYGNGMVSPITLLQYLKRGDAGELEPDEKVQRLYERLKQWREEAQSEEIPEQHTVILYIGDHDPSGMDITRDTLDKLAFYGGWNYEVVRVAITCDETCESDDPELHSAPAKTADSRWKKYVEAHFPQYELEPYHVMIKGKQKVRYRAYDENGDEAHPQSWEVESLEPAVLSAKVTDAINQWRDADAWDEAVDDEESQRALLTRAAERWEDVSRFLQNGAG